MLPSSSRSRNHPANRHTGPIAIRQVGIILYALAAGVAVFVAVVLSIGPLIEPDAGADGDASWAGLLVLVAVAHAVAAPVLAAILYRTLSGRMTEDPESALALIEEQQMPSALAHATIVTAAVIESVGLLGTVVLMITSRTWLVALPIASVVGILMLVPSQQRLAERFQG